MLCPNCTKELDRPWISSKGRVYCPICHKGFVAGKGSVAGKVENFEINARNNSDYNVAWIAYGRYLEIAGDKGRGDEVSADDYLNVAINRCLKAKSANHPRALLLMGYFYEREYIETTNRSIALQIARDSYERVKSAKITVKDGINDNADKIKTDAGIMLDRLPDQKQEQTERDSTDILTKLDLELKKMNPANDQKDKKKKSKNESRAPLFLIAKIDPSALNLEELGKKYKELLNEYEHYEGRLMWFEKTGENSFEPIGLSNDGESRFMRYCQQGFPKENEKNKPNGFPKENEKTKPIFLYVFNRTNPDKNVLNDRMVNGFVKLLSDNSSYRLFKEVFRQHENKFDDNNVYAFFADDVAIEMFQGKRRGKIGPGVFKNLIESCFDDQTGQNN